MEGVSVGDASQSNAKGNLRDKIKNPFYNLKTFLGQATVNQNKDGSYQITDKFDFPASVSVNTKSTPNKVFTKNTK